MDRKKEKICDLDREFLVNEIFNKSCTYCNTTKNIGCDRVDNTLGHLKTNVIPCCKICNTTRMNNFSYDEMLLLGKVIQKINMFRLKNN